MTKALRLLLQLNQGKDVKAFHRATKGGGPFALYLWDKDAEAHQQYALPMPTPAMPNRRDYPPTPEGLAALKQAIKDRSTFLNRKHQAPIETF